MDIRERILTLETRCSTFALELLRELEEHPQFPELVSALENVPGNLYRIDIENQFAALRKTAHKKA